MDLVMINTHSKYHFAKTRFSLRINTCNLYIILNMKKRFEYIIEQSVTHDIFL
jgi:hypothetical protein